MSNLSRGLWGYHGLDADGNELTVQSTGIGGPSAAVVVAELAELGVRQAIRVGTCVALDPGLEPGATLIARAALAADGVGSRFAGDAPLEADPRLTRTLASTGAPPVLIASTDFYYEPDPAAREAWRDAGATAVDLSAAAVLATASRAGIDAAVALVVAESAAGERLDPARADDAALKLGLRAAAALREAAQPEASAA